MRYVLHYNGFITVSRLITLLLTGAAMIYSQLAQAHPHSFIDMKTTFINEKTDAGGNENGMDHG